MHVMDTTPHKLAQRYGLYSFRLFQWKEEKSETFQQGRVPKPRSGHKMVYYKGHLLAFGGYNPEVEENDQDLQDDPLWSTSKPLFKELWAFIIPSRRWKKLDMSQSICIPNQLASHSLLPYGDKLVLYGGAGQTSTWFGSRSTFAMNIRSNCWGSIETTAAPYHTPQLAYGQAVFLYNGYLYTVGGTGGYSYFMDVHRLNLTTNHWECVNRKGEAWQPTGRYRHEVCLYKDCAYFLGGGTGGSVGPATVNSLDLLPCFDLKRNTWTMVETQPDTSLPVDCGVEEEFPRPRRCHSTVQRDNYVFLIGGYNGSTIFRGTWRLDLETMRWKKLPFDLPKPVYFHASAMTDTGKMFTFGGLTGIHNTRTNAMYSCWVQIPSLKDMCWEAVNHYVPDLDTRKVQVLLTDGIPTDLIERLDIH